jgi:hypothetical protein
LLVRDLDMMINEEQVAFYFELGLTITQWSNVERSLFYVATACLGKQDWAALSSGFFELDSFRAKLAFVDGLVTTKFGDTRHFKKWEKLRSLASSLSGTRNKLAHNPVMNFLHGIEGRRVVLLPRLTKPNPKIKKQPNSGTAPSDALGVRDVIAFRLQISPLAIGLENLSCALAKEPTRFPASLEQLRDPPTLRDIAVQMRELMGQTLAKS